jgi:hypothetical protein
LIERKNDTGISVDYTLENREEVAKKSSNGHYTLENRERMTKESSDGHYRAELKVEREDYKCFLFIPFVCCLMQSCVGCVLVKK